jgi:hypothetical protein
MVDRRSGVEVPKHVEDYVNKLSELRRDTGLIILGYDWSEPMIEDENGIVFILVWNEATKCYHVEIEIIQAVEIKAAGSIAAYVKLHPIFK